MSPFRNASPSSLGRSGRSMIMIAAVAALLAGCGGGGGGGSSSSTSAPAVTTQPKSTTAAAGSSISFTVVAKGSGTLTYQWYKNGTAITGATAATYTIASVTSSSAGDYYATITNDLGTTNSDSATLTVGAAGSPTITSQPVAVSASAGTSASFTVVATGDDLTYQWYKDGAILAGETNASYSTTVNTTTVGTYFVRITNTVGTVDSNSVGLSIISSSAPSINTQPTSRSVNVGGSTTFTVAATGSATLTYQWFKNGTAISGATAKTLTISSAQTSDAGSYYVNVSNTLGTVTSSTATLTVVAAPTITTQPASTSANAGSSVTLSVGATGTGLTYQWYKISTAISGATSASYTFTASTATAGQYKVRVLNSAGSVVSDVATVTVISAPTITSQPTPLSVGLGSTAAFSVTATGNGTLTYQWYKNGAAISGATGSTFTIATTVAGDAADYKVVVSNSAGSTTSNTVALTVVQPPVITSQPTSQTVAAGSSAAFTVTATASGTLTYQWYKNGVLLTGATSATYTISSAAESDEGSYKVVVTNDGVASTTSNTVTLTVN